MDTDEFEAHRDHLTAVAMRMLGSAADADDAVQETWLRANAADSTAVENVGGWLTTITARVCLNQLRRRSRRPTAPLDDPVVVITGELDPEQEAVLAESVGIALQVVLDALSPAERVAFVLHDLFAMPFDDIAAVLGRSSDATRQLASRARRRVRGVAVPPPDVDAQRTVVDAFFAAARDGNLDALIAVLDPEVELRSDRAEVLVGAAAVAGSATRFAGTERKLVNALVDGVPGVVVTVRGAPVAVMRFTVSVDRIARITTWTQGERLARLFGTP